MLTTGRADGIGQFIVGEPLLAKSAAPKQVFALSYADAAQSSLSTTVSRPPLTLFRRDTAEFRPNDAIDDGHLRAFSTMLAYDSRPLLKQAGQDLRLGALTYTRVAVGSERAMLGDFEYWRGTLRLDRIIADQAATGIWNAISQPLGLVVFTIASFAEAACNFYKKRTPFAAAGHAHLLGSRYRSLAPGERHKTCTEDQPAGALLQRRSATARTRADQFCMDSRSHLGARHAGVCGHVAMSQ